MTKQIHVKFKLGAIRCEPSQLVVELLERGAGAQHPEPHANARNVRVNRDVGQAEREAEHAGRCLAANARKCAEVGLGIGQWRIAEPFEIERVTDRLKDVVDPLRLHLRDPARADCLFDLINRRRSHLLPAGETITEANKGDVAIAVVC